MGLLTPNNDKHLFYALILASFISGVITAVALMPLDEISIQSLMSTVTITAALGPVAGTPGYIIGCILIKNCKGPLPLIVSLIAGTLIGTLLGIAYMLMGIWGSPKLQWLAIPIFSGGPLTGLIYYFLQEKPPRHPDENRDPVL